VEQAQVMHIELRPACGDLGTILDCVKYLNDGSAKIELMFVKGNWHGVDIEKGDQDAKVDEKIASGHRFGTRFGCRRRGAG
jgi:hypothetical protein